MSETEYFKRKRAMQKKLSDRLRQLAEKQEEKAEHLALNGRYEEALECYELAGYLKGAARMIEDLV